MQKHLYYYAVLGAVFTIITGVFLYFAYDMSGKSPLAGMFAPVNASAWEHMKLVFFPSFFYSLCGWPFFFKTRPSFFRSFLSGTLTGTLMLTVLLCTYTGILGRTYPLLDGIAFLICAVCVFSLSYQLTVENTQVVPLSLLVILNIGLMVGFFIFTYSPPDIALFHAYASR